MQTRLWARYTTFAAILFVAGCNLFNPSGEGDAGNLNPRAEGEEYFRRGQYQKAMDAFQRAIKADSTNSMAYYGYAKSAVFHFKLDRIGVFDDLQATKDDPEQFAFLQHDDDLLTLRMQAASKVRRVLGLLTERDTLTRWWRYTLDSTSAEARADSSFAARRDFITEYLAAQDAILPRSSRHRSRFPLTDFRMPYKDVIVDFTAFEMLYTITRLYDLDRNDTIDARDSLMKKLQFGSKDGFGIGNLSAIAGDLEDDTTGAAAEDLNTLIAGMQSGLVSTSSLAQLMAPSGNKKDSGSSSEETSQNLDSVIASMGDAVLFYQFGDKLDNDGDGCVDEELLDELDNDFDGFVDEDARVIRNPSLEGVDNDHNGTGAFVNLVGTVDPGEDTVGSAVNPAHPYVLGFVQAYLDTAMQNGQPEKNLGDRNLTTWVKIKKGASPEQMKLRMDIQKDSLVTKLIKTGPNAGRLPNTGTNATKLQNARNVIGGCWRNIKLEGQP